MEPLEENQYRLLNGENLSDVFFPFLFFLKEKHVAWLQKTSFEKQGYYNIADGTPEIV